MANTRNIQDTQARKAKKREQRRALKAVYSNLTEEQLRRFRKAETKGLRKFLTSGK